ncbi:MAG TPA: DUF6655 family protein [Alphaproteobacteria bacterium]|nr:DUF6655 family protein [Alphaproteobacteria bacterium]
MSEKRRQPCHGGETPAKRTGRPLLILAALLALAACSTERETDPPRTATEQLLISRAADRAITRLNLPIPPGTKVFVDASNFQSIDSGYAIGAIKDRLLRDGAKLVDDKKAAQTVVEIRSGALSIDNQADLVGVPRTKLPIPLAGDLTIPEIAIYKERLRQGVAKLAATAYDAKDGALEGSTGSEYGFSHEKEWTVLFAVSWKRDDLLPRNERRPMVDVQAPLTPDFLSE